MTIKKQRMETYMANQGMSVYKRQEGRDRVALRHGPGSLPLDFPVLADVYRVYDSRQPAEDEAEVIIPLGWILDLVFITDPESRPHIEIKQFKDPPGVVVVADGEEVYRWTKEKDGTNNSARSWKEDQAAMDSAMVELLDLKPGDEVMTDPSDGQLRVIRAEEETPSSKRIRKARGRPLPGDDKRKRQKRAGSSRARAATSSTPAKRAPRKHSGGTGSTPPAGDDVILEGDIEWE